MTYYEDGGMRTNEPLVNEIWFANSSCEPQACFEVVACMETTASIDGDLFHIKQYIEQNWVDVTEQCSNSKRRWTEYVWPKNTMGFNGDEDRLLSKFYIHLIRGLKML